MGLSKKLRDSPASKLTRDNYCQTELTLPPILPKEIEDMLKPYFTFTQNQQRTPTEVCDSPITNMSMHSEGAIDHEARDASLRRKLFQTCANTSEHGTGYERDIHLDSPVPQTPEMVCKIRRFSIFFSSFQVKYAIILGSQKYSISSLSYT